MSEQLKNKLYNFYAQPSNEAWDKIVSVLDAETEKNLSEKLTNFQSTPRSYVWDNIAASLSETETPVVPFRKRFSKSLKYVSAAASLIAIAMIVNLFINEQSVADSAPVVRQNNVPITPFVSKPDSDEVGKKEDLKIESSAPLANYQRKDRKRMPLQTYKSGSSMEDFNNHVVANNYPIENSAYLDRYMVFSKASGEAFRLSKKLFDLFACSGNDENCKQNIQAIQERMADPSATVTSDFSGVVAMLQNMNQQ